MHPAMSSTFFRHESPVSAFRRPSGFAIGTTHTSVSRRSAVIRGSLPNPETRRRISSREISAVAISRAWIADMTKRTGFGRSSVEASEIRSASRSSPSSPSETALRQLSP